MTPQEAATMPMGTMPKYLWRAEMDQALASHYVQMVTCELMAAQQRRQLAIGADSSVISLESMILLELDVQAIEAKLDRARMNRNEAARRLAMLYAHTHPGQEGPEIDAIPDAQDL